MAMSNFCDVERFLPEEKEQRKRSIRMRKVEVLEAMDDLSTSSCEREGYDI